MKYVWGSLFSSRVSVSLIDELYLRAASLRGGSLTFLCPGGSEVTSTRWEECGAARVGRIWLLVSALILAK